MLDPRSPSIRLFKSLAKTIRSGRSIAVSAVLMICAAAAITFVARSSAKTAERVGPAASGMPSATPERVPLLTLQNAPDVPGCSTVMSQTVLDIANAAIEDPAETYEANRRAHPNMVMMPPTVECASELWKAVRAPEKKPLDLALF